MDRRSQGRRGHFPKARGLGARDKLSLCRVGRRGRCVHRLGLRPGGHEHEGLHRVRLGRAIAGGVAWGALAECERDRRSAAEERYHPDRCLWKVLAMKRAALLFAAVTLTSLANAAEVSPAETKLREGLRNTMLQL